MLPYPKFFQHLLLENPMLPGPNDGNELQAGMDSFLDDGTDPDAYDVESMNKHKEAIVGRFTDEILGFSERLSPDQIKNSTFGEITDTVDAVFRKLKEVEVYSKAKPDQFGINAPSVIAQSIIRDPSKKAAFDELHAELKEFSSSVSELEGKFSSLKSKIVSFVGDVTENIGQETSQPSGPSPVSESVKRKLKSK